MTAAYNNPNDPVGALTKIKVTQPDGTYADVGAMQLAYNTLAKVVVTVAAAGNYTIPDNVSAYLVGNASGNVANITINAPVNPFDGQQLAIGAANGNVAGITLGNSTGNSTWNGTQGNMTTGGATGTRWVYDLASNAWVRID